MPTMLDDNLLKGYLLGELSEADRARVEEELFSDADVYNRLQAIKAEVTDQYVSDSLSPRQRDLFAGRFLVSKSGREDMLFAMALRDAFAAKEESPQPADLAPATTVWWRQFAQMVSFSSAWKPVMTLAMLILFAGSLWLLSERQRLLNQVETVNRERDAAQSRAQQGTALEKELARAKSQNQELDEKLRQSKKDLDEARQNLARARQQSRSPSILDSVLSMVLAPSVAGRGSERLDEFVLLPEARTAHLQLLTEPGVEGKYFRAEIRPRNGDVIFNRDRLRLRRTSSGTGLRFSLPAARLQNGIYEVSLYSDENILLSTYEFRITRRF